MIDCMKKKKKKYAPDVNIYVAYEGYQRVDEVLRGLNSDRLGEGMDKLLEIWNLRVL